MNYTKGLRPLEGRKERDLVVRNNRSTLELVNTQHQSPKCSGEGDGLQKGKEKESANK